MDLDEPERLRGNRRNGKQHKRLRTSDGTIELSTPRDRHSSYEPQLVKKRETILADLRKNPYRVSDYGTAVKRKILFKKGGRPVIYGLSCI